MDRPNTVVIMTDQQRADLSRREGFPLDTTPFLDSLARDGVWFDKAYTSMPVCVPARASMLTGRYPSAHRVRTNHNTEDAYYTEDLFDAFRNHGYSTAMVGKNHSHLTADRADYWFEAGHLGIDGADRTPEEKAFDDWLKTTHFHMSIEPSPFPLECQIPYRLVSKAEEWIESVADNPLLLWLSFPEPHNPYQVPEPYYSMFPPESLPPTRTDASALETKGFKYQWCRRCFERAFPDFAETIPRARANYMGMLRLLDDQVRRFVEFLNVKGLRDDTIIVFLSDHGDFVGEYGLLRKGPELPEALVRVPLQFAGPGIAQMDGPHPAHVSLVDVMPTLCEAAGIPLPDGVQGRSLWPLLRGEAYPPDEFASVYVEQGFGGLHYGEDEPLDPRLDGLKEPSTISSAQSAPEPSPQPSPVPFPESRTGEGVCRPVSTQSRTGEGVCGCNSADSRTGEGVADLQSKIQNPKPKMEWGAFDCLNSWTQSGTMRMICKGDWKLVFDMEGRGQLFNLRDDPAEMENLYPEQALTPTLSRCADAREREAKYREMVAELLTWMLRLQDPLPLPRRRYVMKRHPRNYRSGQ